MADCWTMGDAASPLTRRLGYKRTRALLLGGGILILLLIAAVMYVRRIDAAEVGAALLFVPVFVAAFLGGPRWGTAAGVAAGAAYVALRYPAIDKVGLDLFWGRIASRSIAYLVFGGLGGLFSSQLRSSLLKLELYDQIDDDTGLFNARYLVQDVDLEVSRSKRYQTTFSVTEVAIPDGSFAGLARHARKELLADVGRTIAEYVRDVDRAVYAYDRGLHRFATVLPETGSDGARTFIQRLVARLEDHVTTRGGRIPEGGLVSKSLTFPGQDAQIEALKSEFAQIDREQHPEAVPS